MKKVNFTFKHFLIILSSTLTVLCLFAWVNLYFFISEFEQTLTKQSAPYENSQTITDPTENDDIFDLIPLSQDELELFSQLALEVAQNYAKFTSADLDFDEIIPYFHPDSGVLTLLESYNSNRYNKHEDAYFENIIINEPILTEKGQVQCELSFDYVVTTSEGINHFPSGYALYFDREAKTVHDLQMR